MISRWLGILLLVASVAAVTAWPVHTAQAQEEEDEDEADDDDDTGPDEGVEEEDEDEKDQPPVTAGGLFTMKSYPIRELYRPLTMTEKVVQARLGLGVDVAAQTAFENWGLSLDARYGARDHVMLLAGFTNAYNFKSFAFYGGIEAGLSYDFIDFRATARASQQAIRSVRLPDPGMGDRPIVAYTEGRGIKFAVDIGFPFRYRATKEIAIIALDTFMSIDFNSVGPEPDEGQPPRPPTGCDRRQNGCGYNGAKPDLQPSIGIATNPIEAISLVLYAQLQVIDFNTEADSFVIPATARIQFSPSRIMDIGGEFTFINLKPGDPDGEDGPLEPEKFYENRFFTLFANFRFGR